MAEPYEGTEILDRAAQGKTVVLEPMKKVLCACQQDPQNQGKPCSCKRAKSKRLS